MVLVDFPCIVKKYAPYFEECFSEEGFQHFKKAISGFILSDNKTLEAFNRMFVLDNRNQSSFNRFFNRQNFDIEKINTKRLEMLQQNKGTAFKHKKGTLSIDSTLLKHYGKNFDGIYYHFDYVHRCFRWSHDLVTLHYSDDQTDYPVYYKLWDAPDWEAVANFFMEKEYTINKDKWENRLKEPQKWRNYIRSRYRSGRKEYPEVKEIYKTKLHIAEDLIGKFCTQHPDWNFPIVLDSGFTSSELCGIITDTYQRDYIGALREDQKLLIKGKEIFLKDIVQQIRNNAKDETDKNTKEKSQFPIQKTTYTYKGKKHQVYTYFANHRVKGFDKKQRLVISFLKKDLSDKPNFMISNRLNWYPSNILSIRRQRWHIETYHQEGKAEGLEKYQVRNEKAIQTYIALVVVTYSILKCSIHDDDLLSSIQQRLQTETDGTLPFLRRLMKAEGLFLLIEHILLKFKQGGSLKEIFKPFAQKIAYT